MTTYGPVAAGWLGKPSATIQAELDADQRGILGNSAGTESDGTIPLTSIAGQQIVYQTAAFSALWDLQQAVVSAFDPNQASGAQLDAVCALSGTVRDGQSFSLVTIACTGTPLTVLNKTRVVKTSDTGARFDSLASATITAVSAWAINTAYVVGNRVTNNANVYQCITSGTSAGSGGPTTTAADITDNTAHWKYLGPGTGAIDVAFEAEAAGAVGALAGTLSVISTPVDGWAGAINLADAVVGALAQTDPALRATREAELAGQGGSTADAIRAAILKVNQGSTDPLHQPPTSCTVFYNDTDITDANGVTPHSVEILVQSGTDQDITQAVWNAVGAGTATVGNQTGTATDTQGNPQIVKWSRPVAVPIYVTATVYYDASQWPAGSNALVAQAALSALLTYGDSFPIGVDVRQMPLGGAIINGPSQTDTSGNAVVPAVAGSVAAPGILDVSPLNFGTTVSPVTSTPVSVSVRQIATFDSSRCVITATSETP